MKLTHRSIIDRARNMGVLPSELAHELLVHDLVDTTINELRTLKAPYSSLNEATQQEVINRVTKAVQDAVLVAVRVISARGVDTIPMTVVDAKFKAKAITVTAAIDAQDPNRHGLIDVAGKLCLLVMAPNDYEAAMDDIVPDRDQKEMPLQVGDILDGMGHGGGDDSPEGDDPLYPEVVRVISETRRASISAIQRKFGIGYNRAGRLIERMEADGLITAPDSHGGRDVLMPPPAGHNAEPEPLHSPEEQAEDLYQQILADLKETGHTSAQWLQMRFAVGQEQAEALIQRLLDEGVIGEPNEAGKHLLCHQPIDDDEQDAEDAEDDNGDEEPEINLE
ncbi:DNA translocase FtsK [Metapseudomonas otitidis]|uniref:DNA translocase FtsK n=1 Tax=Metapseudomonas otitidis TaxID=319939 RepID=UPI001AAFC82F|nr:DNA translocase FtsK [Pseudomonas otitidis]MBO2926687.1 DNA translocase FtsK [Pseudomonas otitidis]